MPINPDRDAKRSDYDNDPTKLCVHSIFYTLQGEGPFVGRPAVFIRLAGCNYGGKTKACSFCDTDFRLANGVYKTFGEILMEVVVAWGDIQHSAGLHKPLIVITGGEPTLQVGLGAFCQFLADHRYRVQIETNGLFDKPEIPLHPDVTVILSPKATALAGYGGAPKLYNRADHLKFLIEADQFSPYWTPPAWARGATFNWSGYPRFTYLSPITVYKHAPIGVASLWDEGLIDTAATRANYQRAAALCLEHGFFLSTQQHLLSALP